MRTIVKSTAKGRKTLIGSAPMGKGSGIWMKFFITKDRIGRYIFIPLRNDPYDCCGFVNLMFGSLLIDGGKK